MLNNIEEQVITQNLNTEGELKSPSAFVVKKRANYKKALTKHKLIYSDKLAKPKLEEAEKQVEKSKTKKTKLISLILMLINIGIVTAIIVFNVTGDNSMSFSEVFSLGISGTFLIISLLTFFVLSIIEGFKFTVFSKSVSGKYEFVTTFKTGAYGRYYDSITPLSLGGEPYQVYYLSKHGFTPGQAMSMTMGKHLIWTLTYVIFVTAILIARYIASPILDAYSVGSTVVSAACWIGYVANAGLLVFLVFMSLSKKVGNKLVTWLLTFLKKIRIVKNYDKAHNSVMKTVEDFQKGIKYFAKSPKVFISSMVLSFASFFLSYTIPYLIFCTFNGYTTGYWFYTMSTCVVIDLAASFIPLPGGTGVAELSFSALFTSLFTDGRLFWAMLLWRLLTYYGYIFQGLIVMIYDYFIGNKKYEWKKRKLSLVNESESFKRTQLEFYNKKVKSKFK